MRIRNLGLVAALALGGLLVCTNVSNAQESKEGKKRGFSPEQRIEQLDKELKLNADQKKKLTALFEDQQKKMRDMRADTSMSQEDRRAKGRTLMEENNKKMKEILTPDQFEKWQKMREEQKGKGGERKGKKAA